MTLIHESHMRHCLLTAEKGIGSVFPNPMVGCIIAKNEEIISIGYHESYGKAHAEVNAINNLPDDYDFEGCTLYVNLEPCSHHGKTPPCAELIISKKIKKVVIGAVDPNPLVSGRGIELLKKNNIEVVYGVLEIECKNLNKRFYCFHKNKRPYVVLKWAQTSNGLMCRWPVSDIREENWISGEESKKFVHELRAKEHAIMVGYNTVMIDNPELTVRHVNGKNPIRVIVDRVLKIPNHYNVFNTEARTLVITEKETRNFKNIEYLTFEKNTISPQNILTTLYNQNINSVLIEGGSQLLTSFIKSGLWDEMFVIVNPNKTFRKGLAAPVIELKVEPVKLGNDDLYKIKNPL